MLLWQPPFFLLPLSFGGLKGCTFKVRLFFLKLETILSQYFVVIVWKPSFPRKLRPRSADTVQLRFGILWNWRSMIPSTGFILRGRESELGQEHLIPMPCFQPSPLLSLGQFKMPKRLWGRLSVLWNLVGGLRNWLPTCGLSFQPPMNMSWWTSAPDFGLGRPNGDFMPSILWKVFFPRPPLPSGTKSWTHSPCIG